MFKNNTWSLPAEKAKNTNNTSRRYSSELELKYLQPLVCETYRSKNHNSNATFN